MHGKCEGIFLFGIVAKLRLGPASLIVAGVSLRDPYTAIVFLGWEGYHEVRITFPASS